MKSIGFIPLRKNSKGIPGKNKRKLLGRPLFSWVLTEAIFSGLDEIYVFTDDHWIRDFIKREYTWTSKVHVMKRSAASANDTASTEEAIFEFCDKIKYDFDQLLLLQATSPFTQKTDIDLSLAKLKEYTSVVSVVRTHRFIWDDSGKPLNYSPDKRPRRQEFEGLLVENGAIYGSTKEALQKSGTRISEDIGLIEMPAISYTEIDTESDWEIVEKLLAQKLKSQKEVCKIERLILDVDGVFTDGGVYYSSEGELVKKFDMRDGMGLEIMRQYGIEVMVITSENSELVASRMKKLQIDNLFLGVKDKLGFLQNLGLKQKWELSKAAYLGDDINDMAAMCSAGWSFTPHNAMDATKRIADIKLNKESGQGAIRETCEFILNYNKRFE